MYTFVDLQNKGLSSYQIKKLVSDGKLYKIENGLYSTKKNNSLLEIAATLYTKDIITLNSAFFHYGLIKKEPDKIYLASVQKARKIKREYDNLYIKGTTTPMVYAGVHHKIDLTYYSDEEQAIIKNLAKTFYVTNGGEEIVLGSTSKYRYCLIKPTDEFRIRFNRDKVSSSN